MSFTWQKGKKKQTKNGFHVFGSKWEKRTSGGLKINKICIQLFYLSDLNYLVKNITLNKKIALFIFPAFDLLNIFFLNCVYDITVKKFKTYFI